MKDHKPTKVTENVTALRPTFPTSSEEEELQERLESPNEETNEVLVNEDEAPPTKEEIHGMKDPAHEAYLHSIRVEQQKHYVENVLKDIARMKERYKDLTGNFTVNNSTLGIIDTSTNATSVLGLLNEKVEILDTTSSSPSQTQVEAADDTRKEKKIHKEEKYSNLSKSVQRFVGLWQLAEERFRNESFLSADRLFDTIEIPPYGAVISSLNGSTGLDWYVNYLNASEGGKQQPILNFKVLRGCSSTSWIRISDSKTKLVVTRPPKPPYDQLPRICLYRGTVVEDRIIGFVYSKDDQSIQDDKFYLLDLSNSSSGYSQIGNFHMYRI